MATVSLSSSKPVSLKVDALVVGVAKVKGGGFVVLPGSEEVDKALKGRLAETVAAMGNLGNPNEVSKLSSLGATTAPIIVAVCVGKAVDAGRGRPSYGPEVLRRATGAAARALAVTARTGMP